MNNTQDKNNPEETKDLDYYLGHIRYDMTNLIKWLVLAVLTGLTVGFISSLFARALKFVTNYRAENTWIFFLLPVSGLVIVFLYQKSKPNLDARMAVRIRYSLRSALRMMCLFALLH